MDTPFVPLSLPQAGHARLIDGNGNPASGPNTVPLLYDRQVRWRLAVGSWQSDGSIFLPVFLPYIGTGNLLYPSWMAQPPQRSSSSLQPARLSHFFPCIVRRRPCGAASPLKPPSHRYAFNVQAIQLLTVCCCHCFSPPSRLLCLPAPTRRTSTAWSWQRRPTSGRAPTGRRYWRRPPS